MIIQVTRDELIQLICSLKPEVKTCIKYTNQGIMRFTGNSWTEDWEWNQKGLKTLTEPELLVILKAQHVNVL